MNMNTTIELNNRQVGKVSGVFLKRGGAGQQLNLTEISKVSGGATCLEQDIQTGASVGYKLLGYVGVGIGALAGAIYHFAVER